MDAKSYLETFRQTPEDHLTTAVDAVDLTTDDMLECLYTEGDVHFLGQVGTAGVVEIAEDIAMVDSFIGRGKNLLRDTVEKRRQGLGIYLNQDKPLPHYREYQGEHPDEALAATAHSYSDGIRSRTANQLQHLAARSILGIENSNNTEPSAEAIGAAIAQAIATESPRLAKLYREDSAIIESTRPDSSHFEQKITVAADHVRGSGKMADWIEKYPTWDTPIQAISSEMITQDAVVALLTWIQHNQLPFIPLIATDAQRKGLLPKGRDLAVATDILLCSLVSDEIIPISIHHTDNDRANREKAEGHVTLTPQDLGIESFSTGMARKTDTGRMATTTMRTTSAGKITAAWSKYHSGISTGSAKRAYEEAMAPAMRGLNDKIGHLVKSR